MRILSKMRVAVATGEGRPAPPADRQGHLPERPGRQGAAAIAVAAPQPHGRSVTGAVASRLMSLVADQQLRPARDSQFPLLVIINPLHGAGGSRQRKGAGSGQLAGLRIVVLDELDGLMGSKSTLEVGLGQSSSAAPVASNFGHF